MDIYVTTVILNTLIPIEISVTTMATAFVLINAEIGAETEVLKGLKDIKEVKEAHMVYGVYDIIARIETDTMQELKDIISWKIRRLDKVRSTLTMIVV
jgi:DNA-binding Lrp family transcriptional regulator